MWGEQTWHSATGILLPADTAGSWWCVTSYIKSELQSSRSCSSCNYCHSWHRCLISHTQSSVHMICRVTSQQINGGTELPAYPHTKKTKTNKNNSNTGLPQWIHIKTSVQRFSLKHIILLKYQECVFCWGVLGHNLREILSPYFISLPYSSSQKDKNNTKQSNTNNLTVCLASILLY